MDFFESLEVTGNLLPGTIFASFFEYIRLNELTTPKRLGPVDVREVHVLVRRYPIVFETPFTHRWV